MKKKILFREGSARNLIHQLLLKKVGIEHIVGELKKVNPSLKNPRGRIYKLGKRLGFKIEYKQVKGITKVVTKLKK